MPPKRIKGDPNDPMYQKIKSGVEQRKQEEKEKCYLQRGDDLFDNPMIKKAKETISQKQQDNWAKIGEEMYNSVDFVDAEGKSQTIPESMMEGAAHVVDSIKSGMHISMLENNERELLKEVYGPKWYKRFGYVEEDLTEIKTYPDQSILDQINETVIQTQEV